MDAFERKKLACLRKERFPSKEVAKLVKCKMKKRKGIDDLTVYPCGDHFHLGHPNERRNKNAKNK